MYTNNHVRCEYCGTGIQGGRWCPWPSSCQLRAAEAERQGRTPTVEVPAIDDFTAEGLRRMGVGVR